MPSSPSNPSRSKSPHERTPPKPRWSDIASAAATPHTTSKSKPANPVPQYDLTKIRSWAEIFDYNRMEAELEILRRHQPCLFSKAFLRMGKVEYSAWVDWERVVVGC